MRLTLYIRRLFAINAKSKYNAISNDSDNNTLTNKIITLYNEMANIAVWNKTIRCLSR